MPLGASPVKKALFLKKLKISRGKGIAIGRNSIFEDTNTRAASKKLLKKITGTGMDFEKEAKLKNRSFDLDREN